MILPNVKLDSVVQMDDRFRIDLEGSSISDGSDFDKIEVRPVEGDDAIVVFEPLAGKNKLYLDWQFATSGEKTISVKLYKDSTNVELFRKIKVLTPTEDNLLSDDELLMKREANILSLLPNGRSSFKFAHRLALEEIVRELHSLGIEVKKEDILGIEDAQRWSAFLTLALIFESNITSAQDVHTQKRDTYRALANEAKKNAIVRLDKNKDGKEDEQATTVRTYPTSLKRA